MTLTTNLNAIEETQNICSALMRTPHYAKMGHEGIFAIVAKAKSLNVDPLDALNGGLYSVQGKVEMASQMMNLLIRQAGHSVRKDPRSDDNICILHGKRADNGDEWCESFSIEEARRAGIYKEHGTWGKYPRDMLFARALSRLARQLYPDVIKGCYVEGEIPRQEKEPAQEVIQTITMQEADELANLLDKVPDYKDVAVKFLADRFGMQSLHEITPQLYQRIKSKALENISKMKNAELETIQMIEDKTEIEQTA